MNKVKVVALAALVSVFSGNVYGLMSIKRRNQIIAASTIITGAAAGAGYYYWETTRKDGLVAQMSQLVAQMSQIDISLKDKLLGRTKRIKEECIEWLKSKKRFFAVMGLIAGSEAGFFSGFFTRVFLDRYTVVGLINRVDRETEKAESVVLNPKGHLLGSGYFGRAIGSLKKCQGGIVDYLENSPVNQTLEDGYLDQVMERKAKVEELSAKLVELENRHNEAMAAQQ